ncbi:MAG TPA: thioredoxin domain-containing protein, partial [Myxococcaceae bacterium]|nr:thioredoxin domain-containing protein [Myxococcaceae bacterium]
EVRAVLSAEQAELVVRHFGIKPQGNFEHGTTVLEVVVPVAQLAHERGLPEEAVERELLAARRVLFDVREKRVKPGRDDKLLAGWNGLMIRGLAFASRVFGRPEWARLAAGAADFVLSGMWNGTRLVRSYEEGRGRIDGFLEDYGDLASGLTALYQATFEVKYLEAADAIAARAVELFWDDQRQAYFSAPRGQKDLICATYALHDNAFPSGASTLTEAQVALGTLLGRPALLEQAGRYIKRMRDEMVRNPFAYGHLLLASDSWLDATEVTLVGDRAGVEALTAVVNGAYAPTVHLLAHDPAQPVPALLAEALRDRDPVNGQAAAYFCRAFACELPLTSPIELKSRVARMSAAHVTSF